MIFISQVLTNAALALLRERKQRSITELTTPATVRPQLREAGYEDFDRINALASEYGQGPDSLANWHRLWRDNPAVRAGLAPERIGWVLECSGDIVGFLGSIPLLYQLEGRAVTAAATCRLVVTPQHRSSTVTLVLSYLRQKDIALFLNTTATPAAGRIMSALQAKPLPQSDYGTVLFWVLRPRPFSYVVLRRFINLEICALFFAPFAAAALAVYRVLRQRVPHKKENSYEVTVIPWSELGAEFDQFCVTQTAARTLFAMRNAEWMRWHFLPPHGRRKATMLFCRRAGKLVGYAVIRENDTDPEGLTRVQIADLVADRDDEDAISALFIKAYTLAKQAGVHVIEILGFPESIRRVLLTYYPYSRQYPANPYFYKTSIPDLALNLAQSESWYASPYDGDATLWP